MRQINSSGSIYQGDCELSLSLLIVITWEQTSSPVASSDSDSSDFCRNHFWVACESHTAQWNVTSHQSYFMGGGLGHVTYHVTHHVTYHVTHHMTHLRKCTRQSPTLYYSK